jgi:hypothetical protein
MGKMITSAKYVNYIVETLNILRQELISLDGLKLYDGNIHAENFICTLLNMCYDYELINLNEEKSNFPGLDLGDKNLGIGVQITSTKTSLKVNNTLEKCCNHECYKTFPKIKIFILTEKQNKYSVTYNYEGMMEFDVEKDILDFDSLYIKIMYLSVTKQRQIADYILQEIPIVSSSLGVDFYCPSTYKRFQKNFEEGDWIEKSKNDYIINFEHNFGYIPQCATLEENGQQVSCEVKPDEKTVTIGATSRFKGKIILS